MNDAPRQAADAAIARVLAAERAARVAVEHARTEVAALAENTRADARALAERTERRIRAVVEASGRKLAVEQAEIDAQALRLDAPQPLSDGERALLQRAVAALAHELVGGTP